MFKDISRPRCVIGAFAYLVLSCAMALCLLYGLNCSAEQSGIYSYEMTSPQSVRITGYLGSDKELVIPESLDGFTVDEIGRNVFSGNQKIKAAVLPHSISVIGDGAFKGCPALESVSLNGNTGAVLLIGNEAFSCCTILHSADFDAAYVNINKEAFSGCNLLETVRFSDDLQYLAIRDSAFAGCRSLEKIHTPDKDFYAELSSSSFSGSKIDAEAVFPRIIYSDITQQITPATAASEICCIYLSADCKDRNHVGNEWSYEFKINGQPVKSGDTILLHAGDSLRIYGSMTEDEKYPDFGEDEKTITVSSRDLAGGFIVRLAVTVREDHGAYEGNACTWIMQMAFQ